MDAFKEFAVTALTERDPAFELPREERYAAVIHKKVLTRSTALRKGLANSLALLGNRSEVLVNCMSGKAKETARLVIRDIFVNADWVLWGSLNRLLPALAEAAPNEFLSAVEDSLNSEPCPFDKLFSQEGNGSTGRNYLTELLWALETLAWDKNYLVQVCLILGKLASRDPGGNWGNRPVNSLATILLPWFPQTIAPIEKHRVAVQTLCKEQPEVAWELIISLLPNQDQMSVGSHKPLWRDTIPDDWEERVTIQEYWDQVSFYSELAVSIAENDTVKLRKLIDHFDKLYEQAGNKFIEILSSYPISILPEEERLPLWNGLTKFISWHRRFPDAKWSLNDERLSSLEAVAKKLSPSNIENLYQPLFSNRYFDFYEESDSWEEKERKISELRQKSVQNILKSSGIKSVIQFAKSVESPKEVGHSLGCVSVGENDAFLLPEYLGTENAKLLAFVNGYIWGRYKTIGWSWVDKIDKSDWNSDQIAELLSYLPFTKEAWERAADWLGDSQRDYWLKTNASPYQVDSDLSIAIDKLIDYGRSHAAIRCLYSIHHSSQLIDVTQCVKALFAALSSEESYHSSDIYYYIAELITMLQESEEVDQDDLLHIEWGYLSLLKHYQGFRPKLLENRLTSDPEFFCDKLHLMYRSKKIDAGTSRLSEKAQRIATDVCRLFHNWRIPPGLQEDGGFDSSHFLSWLQSVKDICAESGHLEVALTEIGKILIYCPPDPCGLWINRTVADALNATDAEDMRKGFQVGILNSRGAHEVDPTGKPERELAKKYQKKADNVENAGYYRLAVTLRDVSESYDRYAEHIVSRYGEGKI